MNKVSKKSLENRLNFWETKKVQLENVPIIKALLEFEKLPQEEKQKVFDEWNDYYQMVNTTKAYRRYEMIREAFEKGDLSRVKEIALVSRKALEQNKIEIVKPRGIDYEGTNNCYKFNLYKQSLSKISQLKNELAKMGDTYYLAEQILT